MLSGELALRARLANKSPVRLVVPPTSVQGLQRGDVGSAICLPYLRVADDRDRLSKRPFTELLACTPLWPSWHRALFDGCKWSDLRAFMPTIRATPGVTVSASVRIPH